MGFRPPPENFPWKTNSKHNASVWYALMTITDGKISYEPHGSSGMGVSNLVERLISLGDRKDVALFGVWTGQYSTDLFVLDIPTAISNLKKFNGIA